jgi:hypothetical protein
MPGSEKKKSTKKKLNLAQESQQIYLNHYNKKQYKTSGQNFNKNHGLHANMTLIMSSQIYENDK